MSMLTGVRVVKYVWRSVPQMLWKWAKNLTKKDIMLLSWSGPMIVLTASIVKLFVPEFSIFVTHVERK